MSETINGISQLSADLDRPLIADVQYMESYISSSFNRKMRGIVQPGVYTGFKPELSGGLNVTITSSGEKDKHGAASVDVGEYQISVQQLKDVTVTLPAGATTRIMLEANYKPGVKTDQVDSTSPVKSARIFLADIKSVTTGNQIELCRINVPTGASELKPDMIDTSARLKSVITLHLSDDPNNEDPGTAATPMAVREAIKGLFKDVKLTGVPTAPTAKIGSNTQQIANTSFVYAAIAELVGSSPEALDTINELAAALGNDADFATTMAKALAGKQPLNDTLTSLAEQDFEGILALLGLGEGSALPVGVPVPWPLAVPPEGWIKYNGAAFDKDMHPKLASMYPSGTLPDLRGEFIRGWDDGREVDKARKLLSSQGDAIRNIEGKVGWSGGRLFSKAEGVFKPQDGHGTIEVTSGVAETGTYPYSSANFNASLVVPTAAENRPRNIAFNYIVRAA